MGNPRNFKTKTSRLKVTAPLGAKVTGFILLPGNNTTPGQGHRPQGHLESTSSEGHSHQAQGSRELVHRDLPHSDRDHRDQTHQDFPLDTGHREQTPPLCQWTTDCSQVVISGQGDGQQDSVSGHGDSLQDLPSDRRHRSRSRLRSKDSGSDRSHHHHSRPYTPRRSPSRGITITWR